MSDPAIEQFFKERKEGSLKKSLKASMSETEKQEIHEKCEQEFAKEQWLPDAAKRASRRAFSSHPSKFSHPSTGIGKKNTQNKTFVTPVICEATSTSDGFIRSGNVTVELDSLGDAAALDVDKFLSLKMEDGQTLLEHLKQDSELARSFFTIKSISYNALKQGFLAIASSSKEQTTSSLIKQVYFPVDNDYHQLSILTPSGIVFDLRKRLDELRFGEQTKAVREKKRNNEYDEDGFREIYGLTTIGYGGAHPKNISVLANQNSGNAHLLLSAPPKILDREVHFPTRDFFAQNLHFNYCKDIFFKLHQIYMNSRNNMHIRADRDQWYLAILERIVEKSWQLRAVSNEQFIADKSLLLKEQQIWLLDAQQETRIQEDDWLEPIADRITHYIFHGYEKVLGKQHIKLGDAEKRHIAKLIEKNKEVLR